MSASAIETAEEAPGGIAEAPRALPSGLIVLLATACGLLVANIYLSQPIVGPISTALGLSPAASGLIVTLVQLGYGLGLLLLVPLGDLVENRRLVTAVVLACAASLLVAALSGTALPFLLASLAIGACAVAAQILVPFAAHLAPEALRGRVVGQVMSGLLLGIMLARPLSSLIASVAGWQAVFFASAAAMAALALVLSRALPRRQPRATLGYGPLLLSMAGLWKGEPVLRYRALVHAGLFAAFSVFWTAVPLHLAADFGLGQRGIALFALAGVAGAVVAPMAGRLADRGQARPGLARGGMLFALALGAASFGLSLGGSGQGALIALALAGILLDAAVTLNLILSQRAIFALGDAVRNRLNGLFMATFFVGGAAGSALGGWTMARGGWGLTALAGAALPAAALLYALLRRPERRD